MRQVIGWREFIKGIDREYGGRAPGQNALGQNRQLTEAWYDGTTGLPPLDMVITRARDHAYVHHIERLMVAGAAMLMSDVHPDAAYRWFMEMFIDSADWVMRPNVYGMSQHADGGLFSTKPYVSGSAYLLKMSDFPRGEWCEVWDGLYWRFILRHRDKWAANPRMTMAVRAADRLEPVRRDTILDRAEDFVERNTRLIR